MDLSRLFGRFKMDEFDGGDGGDGGSDDFDSSSDDALAAAGEAELQEIDEAGDEDDSEEHSDEEQVEAEESEEQEEEEQEEAPKEEKANFSFKDKTGNFDWKRISDRLGDKGGVLEKSFKETQATITRFGQENAELKEQLEHVPVLQQRAQLMDQFDQMYNANPAFRSAVDAALGNTQGAPQQPELPPGVNPQDPLVPLILRQQQQMEQFLNRQRMADQAMQQREEENRFLQGLSGAKAKFKELIGRDATKDELKRVAAQMNKTRYFEGAEWVPTVFASEILASAQEKATKQFQESRKSKLSMPKTSGIGKAPSKTQKRATPEEAFNEEWERFHSKL